PISIEISPAQGPDHRVRCHLREVTAVAVTSDLQDRALLSASEDGTVQVWDRLLRRRLRVLKHSAAVRALACSPAGAAKNLCLAGTADGSAWIWDLDGRAESPLHELKGQHTGSV